MRYVSTRGQGPAVSFLDAVLGGMAPDGGLYVPEAWPRLTAWVREAGVRDYASVAAVVLELFAGGELTPAEIHEITTRAYGLGSAFDTPAITPLLQLGANHWLLDLARGPSLAFKDIGMQMIAPLYDCALKRRDERLTVVCATSGDTGGAAVEALKRSDRTDLFVLLPKRRVSDVQRRFMTASGGANVYAIEIESDFDECQTIVKAMFADRAFAEAAHLSGVNSINWARIVAQSVYFLRTASALCGPGLVDFVIPSGNLGDAFAGYVAKKIGAPVGRLGVATNANDILARALQTGRYQRAAQSAATLSPAMDIQVASNFERLVYDTTGGDGAVTAALFGALAQSGGFDVPEAAFAEMRAHFAGIASSDERTAREIGAVYADYGMLVCPHTAVGMVAFGDEPAWSDRPTAFLATAHPAKFPDTVERATGVRPPLPVKCADLFARTETFDTLPADVEAVKRYIRERSRACR
jgi:threonine synthase